MWATQIYFSFAMKQMTKNVAGVGLVFTAMISFGLWDLVGSDVPEVSLESKESKTVLGGPVFNKIRWFQSNDKDIWMMNQSHHFLANGEVKPTDPSLWDRLAIVIDKTKRPHRARFYQLEPGPLEWREDLKEVPFKVACFMCHNNGPRAIRPNYDSPLNPTRFKESIKITYWNMRMRFYGRVLPDQVHDEKDPSLAVPFRFQSRYENEPLKVKACSRCHNDSEESSRGFLSRQQMPTIRFMLESGQMPPAGKSLTSEEKQQLEKFLAGF